MIQHLPEGLVPFEDCGYARSPELPLVGQPIRVACRVEGLGGPPILHWQVDGMARRPLYGTPVDDRHVSFDLGAYEVPCRIRYHFAAGEEVTLAYTCDVCAAQTYSAPQAVYAAGDSLLIRLCGDAYLRCAVADSGFVTQLLSGPLPTRAKAEDAVLRAGEYRLSCLDPSFLWKLKRYSETLIAARQIVVTRNHQGTIVAATLCFDMAGTHRFGLGERFDGVDQRGKSLTLKVVEKFTRQGDQSYIPAPLCFSEAGIGWLRMGCVPSSVQLGAAVTVFQEIEPGPVLLEDRWLTGAPQDILRKASRLTGQPKLPPDWAFGLWISGNGWNNDAEVDAQLDALKRYDYPASVMVLEAWSDEQTFHQWNGPHAWRDPADTVRRIRAAGLHPVLWQIPIIKREWENEPGKALRQDEAEAIAKGYCVRTADGAPYRIPDKWFHGSLLLDFTNPEAVDWWFSRRRHLLDMGIEGFKTDGGEFLFDKSACLYNGLTGRAARNLYPNLYISAYHRFMEAHGVPGVTFSRAGFAGGQAMPLHWAGDQTSEWPELAAQLSAGLSAGLSGILFWGFDIGGFAGPLPTPELYLRATAMACFAPVMQWHSEPRGGQFYATHEAGFNNDRSPWNLAAYWKDDTLIPAARALACLRRQLEPYIVKEAAHCAEACRPLMAHLCVDFPGDEKAWTVHDAYMFGRSLLVAPILEAGRQVRSVYLPAGQWRHYFTKEPYAGGRAYTVSSPLGGIPVFERCGRDS